jgi:DNA-binding GntR family transcriptional regulator
MPLRVSAVIAPAFKLTRGAVTAPMMASARSGEERPRARIAAIVKPLSAEEILDIAEIRLALITLAAKGAYRHLSPADFDVAHGLAKQITRSNNAKETFEYNRRFWDIMFEKTSRLILWEVFTRLDDRMTRYYPLILKLFPNPASRPRQYEVLIEHYRKGKVDEAVRAFKKIYLEVVHQITDHLETGESSSGGY